MKTLLQIGICLLFAAGFAACESDETPTTGHLVVNSGQAATIFISTEAGNLLIGKEVSGGKFETDLNPGNYSFSSTPGGGGSSGINYFQIRAGHTTVIYNSSTITITHK